MLTTMVQKLLSRVLDDYMEPIKPQDMEMNMFTGNIEIHNITLKKSFFDELNIPFTLQLGTIQLIKAKVSIMKLGSEPIDAAIDGIYLYLVQKQIQSGFDPLKEMDIEEIKSKINAFIQKKAEEIKEKVKQDLETAAGGAGKGGGFMQNVSIKVIDNLQLHIKNVHLRVEGETEQKQKFAIGFMISELLVFTTNEKWEKTFIDRTDERFRKVPLRKILQLKSCLIYLHPAITKSILSNLADLPEEEKKQTLNYCILKPLSITMKLTHNTVINTPSTPRFEVSIKLTKLNLQVSKAQKDIFVSLSETAGNYLKEKEMAKYKRRSEIYKPLYRAKEKDILGKIKSLDKMKNENAVLWWKYFGKSIKMLNREKKIGIELIKMSNFQLKEYEKLYMEILLKTQRTPGDVKEKDKKDFERILSLIPIKTILEWTEIVMYQIEKKQQETDKLQPKQGLMGSLFSWGAKKEEKKISIADETKQILSAIIKLVDETKLHEINQDANIILSTNLQLDSSKIKLILLKEIAAEPAIRKKESLVLRFCGVNLKFDLRQDGMSVDAKIEDTELSDIVKPEKEKIKLISIDKPQTGECFSLSYDLIKAAPDKFVKLRFNAGSLCLMYQQILISKMISFFGKSMSLTLVRQASETASRLSKLSIDAVKEMLGKVHFDIKGHISSPIIVIPFKKNNDPSSPLWVFRLGDLLVNTIEPPKEKAEAAEKNMNKILDINAVLSAVNIEHHQKLGDFQQNNSTKPYIILKDFSTEILLGFEKASASGKSRQQPIKTTIQSKLNGIHFSFTPDLYDNFLHIGDILKLGSEEVDLNEGISEKDVGNKDLPNLEDPFSPVKKLKKEETKEKSPRTALIKLPSISEELPPKVICNLSLPNISVDFNKPAKSWIKCELKTMNLDLKINPVGFELKLVCNQIQVSCPKKQQYETLVAITCEKDNALECSVKGREMNNLMMAKQDMNINVAFKLGSVYGHFFPKTMKKFIQYVSTIRGEKAKKRSDEGISEITNSPSSQHQSFPVGPEASFTCLSPSAVPDITVAGSFQSASLICMHSQYLIPFIKCEIKESSFNYLKIVDHEYVTADFGDLMVFDMSNYPNTLDPREKVEQPFTKTNKKIIPMLIIEAPKKSHTLELNFYMDHCPKRPKGPIHMDMEITLTFERINGFYIDELTLKRQLDYILDQLIYSCNPKEAKQAEKGLALSNSPIEKLYQFSSPKKKWTKFICIFKTIEIELKPRISYESGFILKSNDIVVSNQKEFSSHRYLTNDLKSKYSFANDIMTIEMRKAILYYDKDEASSPFSLAIKIDKSSVTPEEFDLHDCSKVNLGLFIDIKTVDAITVTLNQQRLNMLMQCIDLNICYSDGLAIIYKFSRDPSAKLEFANEATINFDISIPKAIIKMLDDSNAWFIEAHAEDIYIKSKKYPFGKKRAEIEAANIKGFQRNEKKEQVLLIYPNILPEKTQAKHLQILIDMTENNISYNIVLKQEIAIVKLNTIFLSKHLFSTALPDYEKIQDKPNGYYENRTQMNYYIQIKDCSLLMANETYSKAISLEGDILLLFSKLGLEDYTHEYIIYSKTCESDPETSFKISSEHLIPVICSKEESSIEYIMQTSSPPKNSSIDTKQYNKLIDFPIKRLLADPFVFEYELKQIGNNKGKKSWNFEDIINFTFGKVNFTFTYSDLLFMLALLYQNILHLADDYLRILHRYYSKLLNEDIIIYLNKLSSFNFSLKQQNLVKVIQIFTEAIDKFAKQQYEIEAMKYSCITSKVDSLLAKKLKLPDEKNIKYTYGNISKYESRNTFCNTHFDIIIVNDSEGIYFPLIRMQGDEIFWKQIFTKEMLSAEGGGMFWIDYYLGEANTWEPLLEKIAIKLKSNISGATNLFASILHAPFQKTIVECTPDLNINITKALVETLTLCWKSWNNMDKESGKKKQQIRAIKLTEKSKDSKASADVFSEYTIENDTEFDIKIIAFKMEKSPQEIIKSHERVTINMDTAELLRQLKSKQEKEFLVHVEFVGQNIPPINNVNLAKPRIWTHAKSPNKDFLCHCSILVDKLRTVFTLRTSILIVNNMEFPLYIFVHKEDNVPLPPSAKPDYIINGNSERFALPNIYEKKNLFISIQDNIHVPLSKFSIYKLLKMFNDDEAIQITIGHNMQAVFTQEIISASVLINLHIWAPYTYKNCLPVPISIKVVGQRSTSEFILQSQACTQIYNQSIVKECEIEIAIEGFEKSKFKFKYDKKTPTMQIQLNDSLHHTAIINLTVVENINSRLTMVFYASALMINESNMDLIFYYVQDNDAVYPLANQNMCKGNTTILNYPCKRIVSVCNRGLTQEDNSLNYSNIINLEEAKIIQEFAIDYKLIKSLNIESKAEFIIHKEETEFTLQSEIANSEPVAFVTQIFRVSPKYFIINKSNAVLQVRQENIQNSVILVPVNEKMAYSIYDSNKSTLVNIQMLKSLPSVSFSLEFTGRFVQQLLKKNEKGSTILGPIIRIEKYIMKGINYCEVFQDTVDSACYLIRNSTKNIHCEVWQKGAKRKLSYHIKPNTVVPFGWITFDANSTRSVYISFYMGKDKRMIEITSKDNIIGNIQEYILDDVKPARKVFLQTGMRRGCCVYVGVENEGNSKVLSISDSLENTEFGDMSTREKHLIVGIKGIGISFIAKYMRINQELLFLYLKEPVLMIDELNQKKDLSIIVKNFQLDNNIQREVLYPVIILPIMGEKYKKSAIEFKVAILKTESQKAKTNVINVLSANLSIAPMRVNLEEDILLAIQDMFTEISAITSSNEARVVNKKAITSESTGSSATSTEVTDNKPDELILNIAQCFLPAIDILVTFQQTYQKDKVRKISFAMKIIKNMFYNVKELPINVAPSCKQLSGNIKNICLAILAEYQHNLMSQKVGLVSGALVNRLLDISEYKSGMASFMSNVSNEGPAGLITGTGSIVKSTLTGTIGAASKVTGSISSGVLTLAFDDEYVRKKAEEDQKEKPSNVFEGLGLGVVSVFSSIFSGVAGIVTKPIEGAQKEGVKGFFKGTGKGLVGVVAKPVSGALDLVSKTTEGVKNTANYFTDSDENKDLSILPRVRKPRPFYTYHRIIKPYVLSHAIMLENIMNVKKDFLLRSPLLRIWTPNKEKKQWCSILITQDHIFFTAGPAQIKQVEKSWVKVCEITPEGDLSLHIGEGERTGEVVININDKEEAEEAYHVVNEYIKK